MSKSASTGVIKQQGSHDVISQQIKITNTGDGLSQAMQIEPREFEYGDTMYVVLEVEVAKITYDMIKDTDCLKEIPSLKAGTATFVDSELVADLLAAQQKKINEAKGLLELDLDGANEDGDSE